jgi:uncharacterized protein YukE
MHQRSQELDELSTRVGSTSVGSGALGSLGSNTASSSNSHIQRASQAVSQAAQTHRTGADNLRRSASAYEEADEQAAQSFRAINSRSPSPSTGPYDMRPGTAGGHPWLTNPRPTQGPPPAWGPNGPTKQDLDEFGKRWSNYHTSPGNWMHPDEFAKLSQADQQRLTANHTAAQAEHQQHLADLNNRLRPHGFQIGTVHHDFDPVVRPIGHNPTSYQQFVDGTATRPPASQADAQQLHEWTQGTRPFNQLPPHLQDIAVITHVAENGRNFGPQVAHFDQQVGHIAALPPGQDAAANQQWQALLGRDHNPSFVPAGQNVNAETGFGRPIPAKWNSLPQHEQDAKFDHRITTEENRIYQGPPSPTPHEEYDTTPLGPHDRPDPNRFYLPQGYPLPPGVQRPQNTYEDSDDEMNG